MEEWLVSAILAMYDGASTVVRTLDGDSNSFEVKVGLHHGSVLSPLPFIRVMDVIIIIIIIIIKFIRLLKIVTKAASSSQTSTTQK